MKLSKVDRQIASHREKVRVWERKLSLALTKLKKYNRAVQRLERKRADEIEQAARLPNRPGRAIRLED